MGQELLLFSGFDKEVSKYGGVRENEYGVDGIRGWAGGEVGISSRERLAQTLLAAPILSVFCRLCYATY